MSLSVNAMAPGGVVLLGEQAIRQLVQMGNGDAALLYLHLLGCGDVAELKWPAGRVSAALSSLTNCGLVHGQADGNGGVTPCAPFPQASPSCASMGRPVIYEPVVATQSDIVHDLYNKPKFPEALNAIEDCIGKKLSVAELQKSHQLFDNLNQSFELLRALLDWCSTEQARKYGEGHRPNISTLAREGCIWARKGIDTLDAARAYTQEQAELYGREKDILQLLDIKPRNLIQQEREFIAGWLKMGFSDQLIRMAYERTILKIQKLDWKYIDSILKGWHQEGRHTVEEVKAGPKKPAPLQVGGNKGRSPDARAMEDMERMRRLMEKMKAEDAAGEGSEYEFYKRGACKGPGTPGPASTI